MNLCFGQWLCMYLCVSHRWGNVTWSHFIFSSVNGCVQHFNSMYVLSLLLNLNFVCGNPSVGNRLWHATHNKKSSVPFLRSFYYCTKRIDSLFFILTSSFCSIRASKHAQTNSVSDKLSETKTLLSNIIFSVWKRDVRFCVPLHCHNSFFLCLGHKFFFRFSSSLFFSPTIVGICSFTLFKEINVMLS